MVIFQHRYAMSHRMSAKPLMSEGFMVIGVHI